MRDWVPFDLDVVRVALEHWTRPADRAGWLQGFHAGASGAVLWPRASSSEGDGFMAGQAALWDSQAKKREVSERNKERALKRWQPSEPPPDLFPE